jgi:hypothetical protein
VLAMPEPRRNNRHLKGAVSRVFKTHFLHKPDFDCSIQAPPPMVRVRAPRAVVTAINSL